MVARIALFTPLLFLLIGLSGPLRASEACNTLRQTELQVNQLLAALKADPNKPQHFKRQLAASQKAWVRSVKQQVKLAYSAPNPLQEYGMVYDDCVCSLKTAYYALRLQELQRYQRDVPDGEVCAVPALQESAVVEPRR